MAGTKQEPKQAKIGKAKFYYDPYVDYQNDLRIKTVCAKEISIATEGNYYAYGSTVYSLGDRYRQSVGKNISETRADTVLVLLAKVGNDAELYDKESKSLESKTHKGKKGKTFFELHRHHMKLLSAGEFSDLEKRLLPFQDLPESKPAELAPEPAPTPSTPAPSTPAEVYDNPGLTFVGPGPGSTGGCGTTPYKGKKDEPKESIPAPESIPIPPAPAQPAPEQTPIPPAAPGSAKAIDLASFFNYEGEKPKESPTPAEVYTNPELTFVGPGPGSTDPCGCAPIPSKKEEPPGFPVKYRRSKKHKPESDENDDFLAGDHGA